MNTYDRKTVKHNEVPVRNNSTRPDVRTSLLRRLLASAVDGLLLLILPVIWWHWVQWAQYTNVFLGKWPGAVAMPMVTLLPLTVLWLEAVSGRGLGKLIFGLRVTTAAGGRASLGRQFLRSALKWSPAWVGPAALMLDLAMRTSHAESFAGDRLIPAVTAIAEHLPPRAKPFAWSAEQAMRGMNFGALLAATLALGQLALFLPGRRSLLDRVAGTSVQQ